jgi:TolB protein
MGLVALSGATLLASPASATFPGANGRIAYVEAKNNGVIHTIRPDGSDDQRLTAGIGPSWSADGHRIAYSRVVNGQDEIFTMRADGSGQRRLTHSPSFDGKPVYSPNGRRIVFVRSDIETARVVSMRSNGSHKRVLARGAVFAPVYAPDGKRIAFGNGSAVWTMRPNGSHKRRLAGAGALFDYSPDGKHILFGRTGRHGGTFVMRPDGSRIHRVGCAGVYSPNGLRLVWAKMTGGDHVSPLTDIFTSTVRCTDVTRVTSYGESDLPGAELPSWQPLPNG